MRIAIDPAAIACFRRGTRLRTAEGDRPVETLAAGDLLPTALGRGDAVVRWMGRRRIRCDQYADPALVHPIRIDAGAFGNGMPCDTLWLSPEHAVHLDAVLIPIRRLVNGRTIRSEAVDTVEYWHVELDRHDVILAEGLPVESWLDCGNRGQFTNAERVDLRFSEARPTRGLWAKRSCAPMVTAGPILKAVRRRLDALPGQATPATPAAGGAGAT